MSFKPLQRVQPQKRKSLNGQDDLSSPPPPAKKRRPSTANELSDDFDVLDSRVTKKSVAIQKSVATPAGTKSFKAVKLPGSKLSAAVASTSQVAGTQSGEELYFSCMWRKPQNKKHKTWEGDGVLVVKGTRAVLKDKDTAKDIAAGTWKGDSLTPGDQVTLGGKEIELDESISCSDYMSGKPFLSTQATTSAVPTASKAFKAPKTTFKDPVWGGSSNKKTVNPVPRFDPNAPGALVMTRPDKAHENRFNKKNLPVVDVVIDPVIGRYLRPHQQEGVKFLYDCVMGLRGEGQGAILADEMGLGKTIQTIALIWTLLRQSPYFGDGTALQRVLVVCPVTLVKNWAKEFKKWLGSDRLRVFVVDGKTDVKSFCASKTFEVLIIGYERLRTVVEDIKKAQPPVGLVVCDEGHRLKTAGNKTTQALNVFNTPRRIILSGTPIQNDLSELHAMADWVNPNIFDTYACFKKVYEQPILRSREPNCTRDNMQLGIARNEQLGRVSRNFVLRRTAEILDGYLPPKHEHVVFIRPSSIQQQIYKHILDTPEFRQAFSSGSSHLVLISTLKNLCNSPGLLVKKLLKGKNEDVFGSGVTDLLQAITDANDVALSGKLTALSSLVRLLKRDTDEKIVLVSNYTQTLDILEEHCKNMRYPYCRLDGQTPQTKRQEIVDNFNKSSQKQQFIFLLSSKSGGVGLTITGASRLVLFDSDWNPSNDLQAMARIHRDGQKKPCHIYRFLTTGTMDEKIFQRQIIKTGLAGSLMEPGSTGGKSDAFTLDELRAIFTFHDDTNSQTHDLLACDCQETDAAGTRDEGVDEADDPPSVSFVRADKMKPKKDTDNKKRLAVLKNWTHVNATEAERIDEIGDEILREMVGEVLSAAQVPKARKPFKDESDSETEGASSGTEDAPVQTALKTAGAISFIFSKASSNFAEPA